MTIGTCLRVALVRALVDRDWNTAIDIARTLRLHHFRRDELTVELTEVLASAEKQIVEGMRQDRIGRAGHAEAATDR